MESGGEVKESVWNAIVGLLREGVAVIDYDGRIAFWNAGAEAITGFPAAEVIGRKCNEGVLVHLDSQGRSLCGTDGCPSARACCPGGSCGGEVFLRHRSGLRVPVLTSVVPLADAGDGRPGTAHVITDLSGQAAVMDENENLKKLALFDPVTGLGNRRFAEIHVKARLDELDRYGWPFGVLFADADRFKGLNDRFGHEIGDEALRLIGMTIRNSLRSFESVGRWGGDEFVAVVSNTDAVALAAVAEKIVRLVGKSHVRSADGEVSVTVSVGGALGLRGDTVESVVKRADQAMYACKAAGGGRACLAE